MKFSDKVIQARKISKWFIEDGKKFRVLEDVSFDIKLTKFICIVGSSGGGKSRLLIILAGLERQNDGQILNMPTSSVLSFRILHCFLG